jgi:hypothetical protein
MDKDLRIKELEETNTKLEVELQSTKEHLKHYTSRVNSKEYYEKNKEVIKERVKKYQEKTNYKANYKPTTEQKKKWARTAYLKKKEKLEQEII